MLPAYRRHDCLVLRFIFLATMATMNAGPGSTQLAAREDYWCQRGRTAHQERIATDRHDFTQTAKTVGRGACKSSQVTLIY